VCSSDLSVIDGAVDLQVSLTKNVCTVNIPTGNIRAMDFAFMTQEKKVLLAKSGHAATLNFLRSEALHLGPDEGMSQICRDRDEAYFAFVEEAELPTAEIIVAEYTTEWFWKLFPTILYWRLKNAHVRVLVGHHYNDRREIERRRILTGMGVESFEDRAIPISGYIFSRHDPTLSAAIIYRNRGDDFSPFATRYSGRAHQNAILSIKEKILQGVPSYQNQPEINMAITDCQNIIELIKKGVAQYERDEVEIKLEEIEVCKIKMLTKFVRGYKYKQIHHLIEAYEKLSTKPFDVISVNLADKTNSHVTPPVLELVNDCFVAIEGNTRIYYCSNNKIEKIKCLVVRGVEDPLPSKIVNVEEVQLTALDLLPVVRMPEFSSNRFRHIEGAVRPV
jgi:hypothetical protein